MAPSLRPPRPRSSKLSRPVRSSRTQVQSYHENSSSEDRLDEDTESDQERSRRLSLSLRPRTTGRMPPSYREESTDDDLEVTLNDEPDAVAPSEASSHLAHSLPETNTRTAPPRAPRNRTVKTRSQTKKSERRTGGRRIELGRPLNKRRKIEEDNTPFVGSGVIPPWQTLPYHILFDIFVRASSPLVDEQTGARHSSVQWLVNVALLCRAFHEPALAALYRCPPLIPSAKTHGLLHLLAKPQESLSTGYMNKIKELNVDVEHLLLYKSGPTLGYFELPRLLERTPQVKALRLYHKDDYVVGRRLRSKFIYPDLIFSSMASSSIRLCCWEWNSRFMETKKLLPLMLEKHLQPAFHGLRELRLLHITSEDADDDYLAEASDEREVVLATALRELPDLCCLEFVECSIVNEYLFSNLPLTLTSLTLKDCDEVTAVNLGSFLSSHGQNLRRLDLSHNRHLSLSFIVNLAQSCKNLEIFKMDISMHDWTSYHDVEPHFQELLDPLEIPTWPSTLQEIELIQLRKWDDTTAEVFFRSLIDAAPELQSLRRLVISAILKIGWRDRATFREKWIGKLENTFLRRSAPPDPKLRSIPRTPQQKDPSHSIQSALPDESLTHSDTGFSTPSKRKSVRIAQRKFSEADEDEAAHVLARRLNEGSDSSSGAIQGMCDVVMVRIDNQRPTENQFNEEDFLDDELSGDEDWNGNDPDVNDGSHAW
ncbi:hypothetical protein BO70DRAFT_386171 [Aspergillus heteromorphus CBS 117.55]|uniref:Uncharacterized protein n=1 Tax=Aspergillus heteromorphus CBS 117.55 TaxID=1448321 RepID=A0A317WLK1_9EURO|nr:uncharacterized protein BO70DRAFT_386171 [Aspergillus heteromorphus CBS 117.55]PWY86895.1 hypothetical protein BO70DRAFT_386171 [Aspergillus heteromorphus CBS 117.55]